MTPPFILPWRWSARPRLALVAGALSVLLVAAAKDLASAGEAGRSAGSLIAQVVTPDGDSRKLQGARALALLRARPDVASTGLVSQADLANWFGEAGVPAPKDLSAPLVITARLRAGADREAVVSALARLPGMTVDRAREDRHPSMPSWFLDGAAAALLSVLAAGMEVGSLRSAMRLATQLGATPVQRLRVLLLACFGSAGVGGVVAAAVLRVTGVAWPVLFWPTVLGIGLVATAALLPALLLSRRERSC